MEHAVVEGESFSPDCSTLLMPALSIGNVGQLAVDLLVSSSSARRVAYLDEPSVLPCAGNDAFGPDAVGDLALALEGWVLCPLLCCAMLAGRLMDWIVLGVVNW